MSIKIEIEGLKELRASFTNLEREFDEAIMSAITIAMHRTRNEIIEGIQKGPATGRVYEKYGPRRTHRASAPGQPPMSDTGALARSVKINTEPRAVIVGSQLAYAAYLEYGTRKMAPRPLWVPASEKLRAILPREIETELADLIR